MGPAQRRTRDKLSPYLPCDKKDTATAIGTFTAFQSLCTLVASTAAGLVWYSFGGQVLFLATGVLAVVLSAYFFLLKT